jgi:hypothetical protein
MMTASKLRNFDARQKLVLTYDNKAKTDGAGAQLQRVYATYSVSRLLGVPYLHSPLARLNYQGLKGWEEGRRDPGAHDYFNDLFHIKSDVAPTDDFHRLSLPDISLDIVEQLVAMWDRGETNGKPILAELAVPYGVADRFPDCYEVCKEISPFVPSPREGRTLRVAIHVRWGNLLFRAPHRLLPNSYYISVTRALADLFDGLKFDYEFDLYTEVPTRTFIVASDPQGIYNSEPITVTPETCEEMYRFSDFSVIPNLVHRTNVGPIDCMRGFATADVLVISRSSFSFVGGILNRSAVVLYHPFWHRAPSSWIAVDTNGQFDRLRAREAVQTL